MGMGTDNRASFSFYEEKDRPLSMQGIKRNVNTGMGIQVKVPNEDLPSKDGFKSTA